MCHKREVRNAKVEANAVTTGSVTHSFSTKEVCAGGMCVCLAAEAAIQHTCHPINL